MQDDTTDLSDDKAARQLEIQTLINHGLRCNLDAWIERCVHAEQQRDLLADRQRRNLKWEDERVELLHEVRALRSGAPLQELADLRVRLAAAQAEAEKWKTIACAQTAAQAKV